MTLFKPTPLQIAARELDDAKRDLLSAQSAAEYARRMAEYHSDRIKRLTKYIQEETKNAEKDGNC